MNTAIILPDNIALPPATAALENALRADLPQEPVINKDRPMIITSKSWKRSRSSMGSFKGSSSSIDNFDMDSFLKVSIEVEESIFFPTISWPAFDDNEKEEDEEVLERGAKRRCHGPSSDLSSLSSICTSSGHFRSNESMGQRHCH